MNPRRVHQLMRQHFPTYESSEHEWINVHDGNAPRLAALNELLSETFSAEEVLIEVNRKLGGVVKLSETAAFVGEHMGHGTIRIADRVFNSFVVVAQNCVATAWHKTDHTSAPCAPPSAASGLLR